MLLFLTFLWGATTAVCSTAAPARALSRAPAGRLAALEDELKHTTASSEAAELALKKSHEEVGCSHFLEGNYILQYDRVVLV